MKKSGKMGWNFLAVAVGATALSAGIGFNGAEASENCRVFVPEHEFLHETGIPIRFDFTALFAGKGWEETDRPEEASRRLELSGEEVRGHFFQHASARLSWISAADEQVEASATESRRCLTQHCGVQDFAKSFNRAYRELAKKLPACAFSAD